MILGTAGTGTGMMFYGVGEPIYHLGYNRYLTHGYSSYDEVSQEAINLAFYHWGIHAWLCYTVVLALPRIQSLNTRSPCLR